MWVQVLRPSLGLLGGVCAAMVRHSYFNFGTAGDGIWIKRLFGRRKKLNWPNGAMQHCVSNCNQYPLCLVLPCHVQYWYTLSPFPLVSLVLARQHRDYCSNLAYSTLLIASHKHLRTPYEKQGLEHSVAHRFRPPSCPPRTEIFVLMGLNRHSILHGRNTQASGSNNWMLQNQE
jgi:hypothetical protein